MESKDRIRFYLGGAILDQKNQNVSQGLKKLNVTLDVISCVGWQVTLCDMVSDTR